MADKLRDLRGKFYQIENSFIKSYGKTVGVYGIAAYNVIAMCANAEGENAFPSYHKIAELTGMSQRKAVEAVNQLVELGVLLRESRYKEDGKGQTSNIYTLTPIPYAPDAPPPMHHVHTPYAPRAHEEDTITKTPINKTPLKASADEKQSAPPPAEPSRDEEKVNPSSVKATAVPPPCEAPPKAGDMKDLPAVQAYRDFYRRWPSIPQMTLIAAANVTDVALWVRVLHAWAGRGYKPTNIEGPLDWYSDPAKFEPRAKTPPVQPSKNFVPPVAEGGSIYGKFASFTR